MQKKQKNNEGWDGNDFQRGVKDAKENNTKNYPN